MRFENNKPVLVLTETQASAQIRVIFTPHLEYNGGWARLEDCTISLERSAGLDAMHRPRWEDTALSRYIDAEAVNLALVALVRLTMVGKAYNKMRDKQREDEATTGRPLVSDDDGHCGDDFSEESIADA